MTILMITIIVIITSSSSSSSIIIMSIMPIATMAGSSACYICYIFSLVHMLCYIGLPYNSTYYAIVNCDTGVCKINARSENTRYDSQPPSPKYQG